MTLFSLYYHALLQLVFYIDMPILLNLRLMALADDVQQLYPRCVLLTRACPY